MNILSPSVLSADFADLGREIEAVDKAGAEYIHLDVMDGIFVPSISIGIPVIKSVRKVTKKVFDVHLMIKEPVRYVKEFKEAGADIISVHYEACSDIVNTIDEIHKLGIKACVAINPDTPVSEIYSLADKVEMILIMTVNPGFGGQKYIDSCTEKIVSLRKYLNEKGLNVDIEVDGGISADNVHVVLEAGANIIVAGSAVYKNDRMENVKKFLEIFKKYNN